MGPITVRNQAAQHCADATKLEALQNSHLEGKRMTSILCYRKLPS